MRYDFVNIHTLQTRTPPKPIDARASGPLVEGHTRAGDWHRPTDLIATLSIISYWSDLGHLWCVWPLDGLSNEMRLEQIYKLVALTLLWRLVQITLARPDLVKLMRRKG